MPTPNRPDRSATDRLHSELARLYLPRSPAQIDTQAPSSTLIDAEGRVRALVLQVSQPPSWEVLSAAWRGVQTELDLPAPAVAVSGIDGLQLWFSLAEAVAPSQAHGFLEALRARFLPEIEPRRVRLMPASDATALTPERHASRVPAPQPQTGQWSAFVAPDLAAVFAETPWLEGPPNEEGQATLLRGLDPITPAAFALALTRLAPATASVEAPIAQPSAVVEAADDDPKRFLTRVMNDDTAPLALRIEAAKALLQHGIGRRPQTGD